MEIRIPALKLNYVIAAVASWFLLIQSVAGQNGFSSGIYSRLNPITYYGFTQPYLSGFYGGIGGMPYMSSWQASMYSGNNEQNPMALMGLGMMGPGGIAGGGLGGGGLSGIGGGFGSWNSAPTSANALSSLILSVLCFSWMLTNFW